MRISKYCDRTHECDATLSRLSDFGMRQDSNWNGNLSCFSNLIVIVGHTILSCHSKNKLIYFILDTVEIVSYDGLELQQLSHENGRGNNS